MATHNEVRVVGYVLNDPKFINPGENGKCIFKLRTARREIEGFSGENFADVIIYYSGRELMKTLVEVKQFDVLDIKGVFNILPTKKKSMCKNCGAINVKDGLATMIYPQFIRKLGTYESVYDGTDESSGRLTELLLKNYKEVSNQVLVMGTVVLTPEYKRGDRGGFCRYPLGVDRKYFIKEQTEQRSDSPWVYSYGTQAVEDEKYLQQGSLVFVDGFIHNEVFNVKRHCDVCDSDYYHPESGTQITPYSVEYLSGHLNKEEIERRKKLEKLRAQSGV